MTVCAVFTQLLHVGQSRRIDYEVVPTACVSVCLCVPVPSVPRCQCDRGYKCIKETRKCHMTFSFSFSQP